MKEKLNKLLSKTIFDMRFILEMVFLVGIFIVISTNFSVNIYFGLYTLSLLMIAVSVFLYYKLVIKAGEKK